MNARLFSLANFHANFLRQSVLLFRRWTSESWARRKMKQYVFPEIDIADCEQKFVTGWGPGGSKVNKSSNAVQLKHIPTKCVVKVRFAVELSDDLFLFFTVLPLGARFSL
jgi:protein subunit release factor B